MQETTIAVAILTYRRQECLSRALAGAWRLHHALLEIIVVDNGADPEVAAWLEKDFPQIRYFTMSYNAGCAGRNLALAQSRADIVVTIDDDVELVGTDWVAEIRQAFESDPDLACLNFTVRGPDGELLERDWCHPRPASHASREFETYFILEGACALRRRDALDAGGYEPRFFLGHEGIDLAFRLIDRGKRVIHTPRVGVIHYASPEQRPGWRVYYYYTRNGIWLAYRNFPFLRAVVAGLGNTAKMAFFAARAGHIAAYLRGCGAGLRGLATMRRAPLQGVAMTRLKAIRAHRVPLAGRIRRHLRKRIL